MPISDIITINITNQTQAAAQAGFGAPVILSHNAAFAERIRWYTGTAGMVTDGFTSSSPEYKAAAAIFAQNPHPTRVAIGRMGGTKPTLRWAVTPVVADSTLYELYVNGTLVQYTSDASATATEIITGLKAAIDALALPITTSDQTTYLRIVENVAGAWHALKNVDPSKLSVEMDHADPGVAAELDSLKLASSDWYAVLSLYNSPAYVTAVAAWVEANKKLYLADSQDSDILAATTTDIAGALETAGYVRTAVLYHPDSGAFAAAAWAGKVLPETPGAETWKFKTLAGVSYVDLTPTQFVNATAKSANVYYPVGGRGITSEGTTAGGEFVDITRGRDWLESAIQTDVFTVLQNMKKVPYTAQGIAMVQGAVLGALRRGVSNGLLSDDPAPSVSVPNIADISTSDRANRHLPDVAFDAVYAGAIHKLTISGVISV